MEITTQKTVKRKIIRDDIRLEKLVIDGQPHSLNVVNQNNSLFLQFGMDEHPDQFSVPEYLMRITDEGVSFERYVHRPDHDHSDMETLQVITNPQEAGHGKKGDLIWETRHPYPGAGRKTFYVPFGKREE